MSVFSIRFIRFPILIGTLMLLVTSACTIPASKPKPTESIPTDILTEVAATFYAQINQAEAPTSAPTTVAPPTGTYQVTSTKTLPPTSKTEPFTATSLPNATPTSPPAATDTPRTTFDLPQVQAEATTNCRLGPSTDEEVVGHLQVGNRAEVYGRDTATQWWYIAIPNNAGQFCWVWSGTTQLEGAVSLVPVLSNPTLQSNVTYPGTGFTIDAVNITGCSNGPTMIFAVYNLGTTSLESLSMYIEDLTEPTGYFGPAAHNAPFRDSSTDCSAGGDQLLPGNTSYVGGTLSSAPPSGHLVKATIKLCTRSNLEGQCFQNEINFIGP